MADVVIVNMETGERHLYIDDTGFRIEWGGPDQIEDAVSAARYQWEMGNYGCDCNRALMFARAIGADDPDLECGHTRYAIEVPDWYALLDNMERSPLT